MKRSSRTTMLLAVALAALAGGMACSGSRVQEVVFWQFWPVAELQPLVDKFEQQHPEFDVRVVQLAWQDGEKKITDAIASGEVPDLCEIGSTWMPRLLDTGRLADWSAGTADLRPSLRGWPLCTVGDASYGLPWVLGTRALFYNKALFARAGLDSSRAPETWEELVAAAAAIEKLGGGIRGYGVQGAEPHVLFKKFMPYAWGNGGRILSDDLAVAVFDSPANREALEFYLSLRDVGVMATQEPLDRMFKEGKLGLVLSGAWLLKSIPRDAPKLQFGVGLVPRPGLDHGTHGSFAGGQLLVSFHDSKHKEGALQLARFLVAPQNASDLASRMRSVQPATIGAETTAVYRGRPFELVLMRQFETAYFTPNHPRWNDMETAIEEAVARALGDRQRRPADVAASAVAEAQQRLAELVHP
jgi:multiple sugar transport system substrate-binding protein